MKISVPRAISFNTLGSFFVFLSLPLSLSIIIYPFINITNLIIVLFFIGLLIRRRNRFITFHSASVTRKLIENTLGLMKLNYTYELDILTVNKTRTQILIRSIGFFTVIIFNMIEKDSKREKYIMNTLIKYQQLSSKSSF
ncbi:MAG: hypothetical protein A3C03_00885 [Candidatus Colwellbacteria bacterium RIFCSPHIGHO2_02_FULL_45_17]|uniref:Uncharacterized protein n=2 Tax=Parcubacteria group TaxID=1794811 RepID=A0A0H4T3Z5_9BACT|nr:hypothetical protein [uncultured Parcubacteria bacterium Rifle_16ft_4_minimus_37647]OGY57606.1 MAG: hypothetical protein A3C03_00885 [Candidatus Colwellbacteria bacterium RIFCSPHIGHO2_02_FULL_45_17]OGY62754.1 MAG: hypothetical protein A3G58_02395 [Candidatus Colwellbacteria bacterium RIFCSPLOWO2_12_FULL_46_17]